MPLIYSFKKKKKTIVYYLLLECKLKEGDTFQIFPMI